MLTETGVLGLVGLLVFAWIFCSYFLAAAHLPRVYPAIISVLVITFPLSSSLAFYGSYWSTVIWWFLLYSFLALPPAARPHVTTTT